MIAIENNFSVKIARNDARIAGNNNAPGAAGMLPTVNGAALQDYQVNDVEQTFLNGNENNRDNAKNNTFNAGLEVNWTVFDGLQMFATKARLQELQAIGELRLKQQMEQLMARVSRAYYDAVLSKAQMNTAKRFVEISEKRMEVARAKVNSGKSAKSEILKAQVYYNSDYALLKRLQTNYTNYKLSLNQLMGKELSFSYEVIDSLLPDSALSLEKLKENALNNNIGLLIAQRNTSIARQAEKEIYGERMPQINLRGGYNLNNLNSEAGFLQTSRSRGYHYGAGLSWNLYNGNDVSRRLTNAKIGLSSAEYVYKDSLLKLELNLTQAYNIYRTNIELWQFETNNLDVAKQNFDIAVEQNTQGLITSNDLREAQVILLQNVNRLLESAYNAKLSEVELLRLVGYLAP